MLVSKNPYVVEARQNLTSKNPHFALKTGEKIPQTSRLKSLIFIVEKYGKKLLFNFSDKNHITFYAFAPSGRGWWCIPLLFHDNVMALFAITFSGGNDIVLFLLTLGLKAQKQSARGKALASPRANVPHHSRPASGKSVTYLLLRNAIFP